MAIDRVTINLPQGRAEILEKLAADENRSVSNFVGVLIEADLAARGLVKGDTERSALVMAAVQEIGVDRALKVLRTAARKKAA
jgi:hypothetical protein